MHIPIQVDYGVRALVDLAEHATDGSVRTTEIAKRRGIPEPFLHRVLLTLSKHGLVRSYRGPQGGHTLAKDPSEITMGGARAASRRMEDSIQAMQDTSKTDGSM